MTSMTTLNHAWSSRNTPWERIDVCVASLVAIGGLWRIVGYIWLEILAGMAVVLCGFAGALIGEKNIERGRRLREKRDGGMPPFHARQEGRSGKADHADSLHGMALESLEGFVDENERLDVQIGKAMSMLDDVAR
jgi:hypothetical protein